jgi:hypothetical protein
MYTLELPPDARIYLRFHISLLEPANPETPLQRTFRYETEEEKEFKVERILDYKQYSIRASKNEYLVK